MKRICPQPANKQSQEQTRRKGGDFAPLGLGTPILTTLAGYCGSLAPPLSLDSAFEVGVLPSRVLHHGS